MQPSGAHPAGNTSQVVPTDLGYLPLLAPNNFLLVKWDEEAQSGVVVRDPVPRSTPEQPRQGDPSPLSPDQHFSLNVHGPLGASPQKAAEGVRLHTRAAKTCRVNHPDRKSAGHRKDVMESTTGQWAEDEDLGSLARD